MGSIEKPKILIVDDKPENLFAMELLFKDEPCETITASTGNKALENLVKFDFALVILDVQMPGMDGFELAKLMRSNNKTMHIPLIFATAINKEKSHIFKGYKSGAVDYIFKPVDPLILKSKIRIFLQLYNQQKRLEKAGKKIIEQQKSLLEKERLKVLLEMSGAMAHELNQPLMALLGSIELIGFYRDEPEEVKKSLKRIQEAGKRISDVVKKIQNIRHYDVTKHDNMTRVINLKQNLKILCIEDNKTDFSRIREILSNEENISLYHAKNIVAALKYFKDDKNFLDMIFLDYCLGDGTGFVLLEEMEKKEIDIPVIIISGQEDETVATQLIQAGACEYLSKNRLSHGVISRVIQKAQTFQRMKTDLQHMQNRLVETSVSDEVTGLYNRRSFMESFNSEFKRAKRYKRELSLIIVHMEIFKDINKRPAPSAFDEVLATIAGRLSPLLRLNDIAARYGDSDFAVLLPETDQNGACKVGEKIRESIQKGGYNGTEDSFSISTSIKIATNHNREAPGDMLDNPELHLKD